MTILFLELIIVLLIVTLILESFVVFGNLRSAKKERNELIKMIIAKNLPEYEAVSKGDKPPPVHRSMIQKQHNEMMKSHRKEA